MVRHQEPRQLSKVDSLENIRIPSQAILQSSEIAEERLELVHGAISVWSGLRTSFRKDFWPAQYKCFQNSRHEGYLFQAILGQLLNMKMRHSKAQ